MLENRLHMLENQNTILNNMFIQNQTQAAFRDRQLLMNSLYSQPIIVPPLPAYSHPANHLFPHGPYVPQPMFAPSTYEQFFQSHGVNRPVYPAMQIPSVNRRPPTTAPGPATSLSGIAAPQPRYKGVQPMAMPQPGGMAAP